MDGKKERKEKKKINNTDLCSWKNKKHPIIALCFRIVQLLINNIPECKAHSVAWEHSTAQAMKRLK